MQVAPDTTNGDVQDEHSAAARFFTDQAILKRDQDELGIGAFVDRLIKPLVDWPPSQSLVVGLYGPWGSGKTSILNLIEESLHDGRKDIRAELIRFTPWLYSGTESLLKSFFETLGEAIRSTPLLPKERRQSLATAIDAISKFVGPVFGAISSPYTGGIDAVGPGVSAVNIATQAYLKGGETNFEKEKQRAARELQSLVTKKHQVARFVVLIDDLDRAEAPEIRAMLKLVRLIADLPNITYVLAVDNVRVQRALASDDQSFGAAYLEKIVQIPIPVPPISSQRMKTLLLEGIDSLLQTAKFSEPQFRTYLSKRGISVESLLLWRIKSLRDRARLLNSFRFLLLAGDEALDVDPVDALIVAFLQTFYPEVHERIRSNKEFLTNTDTTEAMVWRMTGRSEDRRRLRRSVIAGIISGEATDTSDDDPSVPERPFPEGGNLFSLAGGSAASNYELGRLRVIIGALFPDYESGELRSAEAKQLRRENRIAVAERFDRYFTFGTPEEVGDAFLEAWLQAALGLTGLDDDPHPSSTKEHSVSFSHTDRLLAEIRTLSRPKKESFSSKLLDRLDLIPTEALPVLAHHVGIAGVNEMLPAENAAQLLRQMVWIVADFRRRSDEPDSGGGILCGIYDAYGSFIEQLPDPVDAAVATAHDVMLWKRHNAEAPHTSPSLDSALDRIIGVALRRMQQYIYDNGNLFEHAEFRVGEAVWRWRDLLRATGQDYQIIQQYLQGVLDQEPYRLPALLGLFAGWSGSYPSLTYGDGYKAIRAAADEIFGWPRLLRSVVIYRKNEYPPDNIHGHLVTELVKIVREEHTNRLRVNHSD